MQVLDCLLAVAFHLPVPVVYDISCTTHVVIAPASDEVIDIGCPLEDEVEGNAKGSWRDGVRQAH